MTELTQSGHHPCRAMAAMLGRTSDSRSPAPAEEGDLGQGYTVHLRQAQTRRPPGHWSQASTGDQLGMSSDSRGQRAVEHPRKKMQRESQKTACWNRCHCQWAWGLSPSFSVRCVAAQDMGEPQSQAPVLLQQTWRCAGAHAGGGTRIPGCLGRQRLRAHVAARPLQALEGGTKMGVGGGDRRTGGFVVYDRR